MHFLSSSVIKAVSHRFQAISIREYVRRLSKILHAASRIVGSPENEVAFLFVVLLFEGTQKLSDSCLLCVSMVPFRLMLSE